MRARNLVHGHETDIVAVSGVAGAGIAEADEEAHRSSCSHNETLRPFGRSVEAGQMGLNAR
jgi:hypothetical protein